MKSYSRERELLQALDSAIRQESILALVDSAAQRLERELARSPDAVMAWVPLPLQPFGEKLPEAIRSGWVFVLRALSTTGAERHPNSHQRTMSYRGEGDLQVRVGDRWRSTHLQSDLDGPLERRWASVPRGAWHQAVVPDRHWVVLSFHTAPENELVEERADPADARRTHRRRYMDRRPGGSASKHD